MCKRTDPTPCQHRRMQSESVNSPAQGSMPQQRRSSAARMITNSGKKAPVQRAEPRVRAQRTEPHTELRETVSPGHRVSPTAENQKIKRKDSQKQAAKPPATNRGPSPRGNKRPCQSPNSGLPNASRGIRVASPSKGSSTIAASISESVYAGAKFSDPPSPTVLPKPPSHWVIPGAHSKGEVRKSCTEMTNILKVMLNVQA